MPSLLELVEKEHSYGPDKPTETELRDRGVVLSKLESLPISIVYDRESFLPHVNVQDLIDVSQKGDYVEKTKFENFLRNCGIFSEGYLIRRVIEKLAYPKTYGREIRQSYALPTIKDVQALVQTGLISDLDGFDIVFNLHVAKILFSRK